LLGVVSGDVMLVYRWLGCRLMYWLSLNCRCSSRLCFSMLLGMLGLLMVLSRIVSCLWIFLSIEFGRVLLFVC